MSNSNETPPMQVVVTLVLSVFVGWAIVTYLL